MKKMNIVQSVTVIQPVMLIAGIPEDPAFIHTSYVAKNLSEILPNFQFKRICKQHGEWEPWLEKFCKTNNWYHTSSPLVWREVGIPAGNATYVGGATQFWEFIHEYYGIESQLTEHELKALKQDFVQEFEIEARINSSRAKEKKLNVAVLGGNKSLCDNLVAELFVFEALQLQNGIVVKLYKTLPDHAEVDEQSKENSHAATIAQTINAALIECDIFIVLDEILRENDETTDHWLNRNRNSMLYLAEQINDLAPESMKVLFCSAGPTCFNAGVLAAAAKKLDTNNIVVVSAHKGLETLYEILDLADFELGNIGCPPIWGFLGINHFVDTWNAVQSHEIYRPNNRALRPHEGTTLSLGTKQAELRSIFYMTHDKNPQISPTDKSEVAGVLKCRAICDLLRLWYDETSNYNDDIISLGICSDGTFDIPKGLYFSQPVYLKRTEDGSRIWAPCSEFPAPNIPKSMFNNFIESAEIIVEKLINLK